MVNLTVLSEDRDMGLISNAEYLQRIIEYLDGKGSWRLSTAIANAMNDALEEIAQTWRDIPPVEDEDPMEEWNNTPDYVKADLGLI